ncbi:unnamed protein product [Meloidogyne enterolobii]|uniref:Uncharacterized protein n=1 Tax=Meloidogyne enterolobii TaxID=390850 RepID=A0ACB0Y368_MELEN
MESSGSSGYSSEDGVFDLTVGSLTVGQFWQAVQNWGVGGHQLAKISMRGTEGDIDVWNNQNPIPVNEFMEEFLRDGTIAFNQRKRAYKLHEAMPLIENRTVKLSVGVNFSPYLDRPGGHINLTYTLRDDFKIPKHLNKKINQVNIWAGIYISVPRFRTNFATLVRLSFPNSFE